LKRGADTVLLDMQYSPRTDSLLDYARYLEVIRDAAKEANVPGFDRSGVMRYWNVSGACDLASLRHDGLYEKVHVCLGWPLAALILRATGLKEGKGLGGCSRFALWPRSFRPAQSSRLRPCNRWPRRRSNARPTPSSRACRSRLRSSPGGSS